MIFRYYTPAIYTQYNVVGIFPRGRDIPGTMPELYKALPGDFGQCVPSIITSFVCNVIGLVLYQMFLYSQAQAVVRVCRL